jgi:succinate dehydrogenase / fumarate reductase membrane anchor subunit
MSMENPLARAKGLGSAKSGTHHWWSQRASSILLIPLTLWLLWAIVHLYGVDHATAVEFISHPVHAGAALLLAGAVFYHAQIGLQVIIEDYAHPPWFEFMLQMAVRLGCLLGFLVAAITLLKLAIGA